MIWIFLLASLTAISIIGALYLMNRARRFGFAKKLYEKNKALGWASSVWPILLCLPFLMVNVFAFVIAFVHLILIWGLCDLVGFIIRKIRKREKREKYITGFIALGLTACYLGYGWAMAHIVFEKDYTFTTAKELGANKLRIVEVADLHLGITLDGDQFAEQCKRINETDPDVVFICGDFVDDDSEHDDMIKACDALGTLKTKYGVYWIYGNHDRGYYRYRNFDSSALVDNLSRNNVAVLRDENVMINDHICVVGREDRSVNDRMSAAQVMEGVDKSQYVIMLDHQPNDYDNEAAAGPDLVLSGHTHGGHIFPAGPIGLLMKANDRIYGTETRDNTTFVVTSGISGWGIPFKTFTHSEYVVIDVVKS